VSLVQVSVFESRAMVGEGQGEQNYSCLVWKHSV